MILETITASGQRRLQQLLIDKVWHKLKASMGDDPFTVAARQGLSILIHQEDETSSQAAATSRFDAQTLTIEIFVQPLRRFWNEMFPGCLETLQYRYACWRELWHYWHAQQFAPLHSLLCEHWETCVKAFAGLSDADRLYFSHYFASLATGLLSREDNG